MKKQIQSFIKTFKKLFTKNAKPITIDNNLLNKLDPKIHLGCGDIILNGWINIDARRADHVHINTDIIDLKEFSDQSVGVIYLSHVLEHFDFVESVKLLKLFYSKLKKGGILLISVPDFDALVNVYTKTKNIEIIKRALMGGQDYEYNYHKSVYNKELLSSNLESIGFNNIEIYNPLEIFNINIGDFSTYEIQGVKISLCVIAKK
jgi:predicted SAM-dependent methyltransferase